ncbi:MAG: zinc ribbon domain-containing protein [Planctomycetota bacterium]
MDRIHLLSCSSCKRQLDVTALEVGDEVQCVCDAILVVGPPKEVQVRGLSCGHCGGVISEGDTTCSYCNAALSAEDRKETTLCPICAARLPNDSQHCKACGVELRAAAVPPLPRDGKCPRCDGPLRVHLLEEAEVVECASESGCGGMWCSRETFERLQRTARKAASTGDSDAPEAPRVQMLGAPEGAKRQYVPCLTCGDLMQRRQFRHEDRPAGIVLDVCKDHGVWFDRDELEAALAFVRSQVRARSGLDPIRPENSATSIAQAPSVKIFDAKDSRYKTRYASGSVIGEMVGFLLESVFG